MILAIDIGNTKIVCGIFRGKTLIKTFSFSSKIKKISYRSKFHLFLKGYNIDSIVISSVVPDVTKNVEAVFKKTKAKVFVVGKNMKVPIKNLYRKPKQVGKDRLVGAYAAYLFYGAPLIVVDFGTATTFDVVTKQGNYAGGIIAPGIGISIESLFNKAALLPWVEMKKPKNLVGKDTVESLRSGLFYGFISLCDGIIAKLKKDVKGNPKVIATGGYSKLLSKFCKRIDVVEPTLILRGLNLLVSQSVKK